LLVVATVAFRVTLPPTETDVGLAVTLVEVEAWVTVTTSGMVVLLRLKLLSPAYAAEMLWVPAES
jgi:hypothetical protein